MDQQWWLKKKWGSMGYGWAMAAEGGETSGTSKATYTYHHPPSRISTVPLLYFRARLRMVMSGGPCPSLCFGDWEGSLDK